MTLTFILIRHCKSDWQAGVEDHARPLNARGRRSAPRIGVFLSDLGLIPGEILCSDAMRTRETWAGIADHMPPTPPPTLTRSLYLAEPSQMLAALHGASQPVVAMVAHNPGSASLAWSLADAPPDHPQFDQYPTGATTVFTFAESNWSEIGKGKVAHFAVPRDLPDPV
ncbi:histidine phosphatase family protein [Gymnodinialimonas sp. 2305UL16-5]|uniref:SixA phosphatase family protein n=1 Tax=Gymnodinialimonas mytili TaxID=3126503 RepID=UPI00309B83BE